MMTIELAFSRSETDILDILAQHGGYMVTLQLVQAYQKRHPGTPKQTVYRSLGILRRQEVVTVNKRLTTVNTIWIGNMRRMLDQMESRSLVDLLPDRQVFGFPSMWAAAPTVAHYANILIAQADRARPILFINPHQWFYLARPWSEEQLISGLVDSGHTLLQGIVHNTPLDKQMIQDKFTNRAGVRGSLVTMSTRDHELYIAVIGDYVFTITMSDTFTDEINAWYKTNHSITPESIAELQDIVKFSGPVKMVIKRSQKSADSYRKHLSKFFA